MAIIGNERNDNTNNGQINETQRANINNSNNIRNAADVAIASKNPYAMAAGGAVKTLDKATGGKSTDAFGKLATRTTQRMPGGKTIQDASNKLSENGASDKIGKAASIKNASNGNQNNKVGNGPTKDSPKNNIAAQKLNKSKSNRGLNLFKNRKKNNSSQSSDSSNSNDESSDNRNSDSETNDEFKTDDLVAKAMKRIRIKIVIAITIMLVAILFIISSFLAIFGINIQFGIPAASQSSYGTSEFSSVYEKGTVQYENEVSYYKALKEASDNYAEEHGETLKTNYIHSILIYTYYQIDVSEEELENIDENSLENIDENSLENNDTDEKDVISIDYKKMESKIDSVVELMTPSDTKKNIDYEKHGEFYNKLKNSNFFKEYYKNSLKEKNADELLDEIFDLAIAVADIEFDDDTVISSETSVTVNNSSNGSNLSAPTVSKMSMNDYLTGSIYANNSISSSEKNKALTIAYSTNLVATNKKLTVLSTNATANNLVCSVKLGCSYDSNGNLVDGPGEQSSKNTISYKKGYYYKQPLSEGQIKSLNNDINSVYGKVLVSSDGIYPQLDTETINGLGDGTYQEILEGAYGKYKIKDVGEDNYINDGSYGTKKVLTKVIFYDQNNYRNTKFCGISNENIKTSGCGTTAMAMVVSTIENSNKYDPIYMMKRAHSSGYCGKGISGTSPSFFQKESSSMKYKYLRVSKRKKTDLNLVLSHLSQGHLVITHMKSGHFTSGGHYMVLGGIDPATKKVYVYDPNNASNVKYRNSGNGWYSFNDIIVKESFNYFYIVWKG